MFKTSYLREVRKEKYERSDVFDEEAEDSGSMSAIQGWESLQELNSRFARYINRARVLEQRNAVFRKQLETLQRMEEASGLEETFTEQTEVNRQRIRELLSDRAKLERELKEAGRMLEEFTKTLYARMLFSAIVFASMQEADSALLRNLEYQTQSQFLQDDVSYTRDRQKKWPLSLNIVNTLSTNTCVCVFVQEQEKLLAQKRLPALQTQLEEYKSALCQLQAQKQRLKNETAMLDQTIKSTQDTFDDEIQMLNEQIENLRKEIEEAEKSLEKFTSECRHLAMYQTSLENELERYKRIIENEDNRYTMPDWCFTNCVLDLTHVFQDITSIKPRQKILSKKVLKKKELTPKDVIDSVQEDRHEGLGGPNQEGEVSGNHAEGVQEERVKRKDLRPVLTGVSPQDVPDGAQISKAFDTLCNIVRDRLRKYKKPEPIADFYTKGRYVLVTGDGSYMDPCFYTSTPSGGHIYVTIRDGVTYPYDPYDTPSPSPPHPQPVIDPRPLSPTLPSPGVGGPDENKGGEDKENVGKGKNNNGKPQPSPTPPPSGPDTSHPKKTRDDNGPRGPSPKPVPRGASTSSSSSCTSTSTSTSTSSSSGSFSPDAMSYEKVEVVESVEKFSKDRKVKGYEETSMVVETIIEKSSKKKH
uniref:Filensin n=1 Tax=Gouania willdenowi TaxID=441366 RepID=A0A8C5I5G2_GOUWI